MEKEAVKATAALEGAGLDHGDILPVNLLWNEEVGDVIRIDFKSTFDKPKPSAQANLVLDTLTAGAYH